MSKADPDGPRRPKAARQAAEAPPERRLLGIPVSPGVAIGPVFGAAEPVAEVVRRRIAPEEAAKETARLDAAIVQSRKQLTKLRGAAG